MWPTLFFETRAGAACWLVLLLEVLEVERVAQPADVVVAEVSSCMKTSPCWMITHYHKYVHGQDCVQPRTTKFAHGQKWLQGLALLMVSMMHPRLNDNIFMYVFQGRN